MYETTVHPRSTAQLLASVGDGDVERFTAALAKAAARLEGRTLWHINSAAEGGGVAELLHSNLGYLRGNGLTVRWLVFEGDPTFFQITKRVHNRLHGDLGDLGPLGPAEVAHYLAVTQRNLDGALRLVRAGDVAVVHDPQPAGLVPGLLAAGLGVIWVCHVGVDVASDVTRSAWDFVRPFVEGASAFVFSRAAYVWDGLDDARVAVIPPCIDPLSLKNIDMDVGRREAIMATTGLAEPSSGGVPAFARHDGTDDVVVRRADLLEMAPVPAGATVVMQVSRWDRLKDPIGVLHGFVAEPALAEAHLILAGPSPASVADDPEAEAVLTELRDAWLSEPVRRRERIHLANLPTSDVDENAIIVNALQRRADVVVQKSLAEGFGLTVTEAMWKERPIVASGLGGITDQIDNGVHGLLVDPRDLGAFGAAVATLVREPALAAELGTAAKNRVRERFLPPHFLAAHLALVERAQR